MVRIQELQAVTGPAGQKRKNSLRIRDAIRGREEEE